MKKQKMRCPFEVMIVIVDRGEGDNVIDVLENNNIHRVLKLQGRGTAESEIADIFGFGVIERDIIACFIDEERSKALVELIYTDLHLNVEHSGLVFTLQPSSASLDLLESLNIEVQNGKN